jgi:hypothetical protein
MFGLGRTAKLCRVAMSYQFWSYEFGWLSYALSDLGYVGGVTQPT